MLGIVFPSMYAHLFSQLNAFHRKLVGAAKIIQYENVKLEWQEGNSKNKINLNKKD